ncbi:MAG: RHS repeat-associated core domain-containing protein [Gemmatimonadetes bacterium]|nr:RHS repeat-associated core domain-containing protein [Gemmatimonadota bacterium]
MAYGSAFRVKTQTVHGTSTVSFSYDRDGLLVAAGALRLGRSGTHGLLLADTLGPVRGSYSYTSRGELAGLHQARSGTTLLGTGYLRDSLGRITQLTDSVREAGGTPQVRRWSYVYDGVGRLLRDSLDGTLHQAFAYDSNGNRTSLTTALGTVSSSYDAQDRLTRSATSGGVVTLYTYGSNGELQTKTGSATGAQTRYQYDALGNLLKVVLPSGDSVEYLIDGQNRRVGRKWNGAVTHRWLYQNQLNPIAELDSAGALVSRFVYGSRANVPDYLVRGGAVYRLVTDHLGSVRAVVDTATGAVAQWTSYDAWGNVLADSGAGFQPFGFAGGLTDGATGLVRFGARDYEPQVGRWTAKDLVGFYGNELALYTYASSDPLNAVDPSGLLWGIPMGEGYAAEAADYWAARSNNATNAFDAGFSNAMGTVVTLWTPGTSDITFGLLSTVYGLQALAFRAEWGNWKVAGNWFFPQGTKGLHFHLGTGLGLGKHHLPFQAANWMKNFISLLNRGKATKDLVNIGITASGLAAVLNGLRGLLCQTVQ